MSVTVDFGIPGLQILQGDHICAFYHGLDDRDEILIPYLRAGLEAGDKCICVVDASDPEAVLAELRAVIDIDNKSANHQLDVLPSQSTYLRDGVFKTDRMIGFWDATVGAALSSDGFSSVRAVGEMTWALRDTPGVDELVGYESELNRFLPRYPQVILCLYDLGRFDGEVIFEVLKTHPKVLVKGVVIENLYYLEPDEFLATR
ncbi:MAG: MEDS domain-containing protein [Candidatus Dormibacteraeota bacterium]|nr:MEDS domain-containing protein [Candidatus Dormibacteraeota bacterium]